MTFHQYVFCYNHPGMPGVGICMRCHRVVCSTCTTRLDGINHCPRCMEALASRPVAIDIVPLANRIILLTLVCLGLFVLLWFAQGALVRVVS